MIVKYRLNYFRVWSINISVHSLNKLDNSHHHVICVVHNNVLDYPMHLSYKTARYKDTIYKSYFLAESYREGGRVRKRNLWSLGRLTDAQVAQINMTFAKP